MSYQRIYVITNPQYQKDDMYKIGYHTGTKKELESRYHTPLVNLKILRFTDSVDCKRDEKELHELFKEYRVSGYEWFKLNEAELLSKYDKFFEDKNVVISAETLLTMQQKMQDMDKKIQLLESKISSQDSLIEEISNKLENLNTSEVTKTDINIDPDTRSITISFPSDNVSSDFDEFINYIKTEKPSWFKSGEWQHQYVLYDHFKDMYGFVTSMKFTLAMKDRIFCSKKSKRINGHNRMAFHLFNWEDIN